MSKQRTGIFFALILTCLSREHHSIAADQKILFLRGPSKAFEEVFSAMRKDLAKKYKVADFIVSSSTSYEEVKEKVKAESPQLSVLMDNKSVSLILKYNSEQAEESKKVHGVALMALNLKSILKNNAQFSGIAFEIPAYSLLTQFRYLVQTPVKKVLVFYRKSLFEDMIADAVRQLATEGIALHPIDLEKNGKSTAMIEKTVAQYLQKPKTTGIDGIDAVWVMLDSVVLSPSLFQSAWLPAAHEWKVPFLSGTETLAAPEMNFATFVITPHLKDLATQAMQQIEAQLNDRTEPREIGVEELISVNKILNMKMAKELGLKLKGNALVDIKVLE